MKINFLSDKDKPWRTWRTQKLVSMWRESEKWLPGRAKYSSSALNITRVKYSSSALNITRAKYSSSALNIRTSCLLLIRHTWVNKPYIPPPQLLLILLLLGILQTAYITLSLQVGIVNMRYFKLRLINPT